MENSSRQEASDIVGQTSLVLHVQLPKKACVELPMLDFANEGLR